MEQKEKRDQNTEHFVTEMLLKSQIVQTRFQHRSWHTGPEDLNYQENSRMSV